MPISGESRAEPDDSLRQPQSGSAGFRADPREASPCSTPYYGAGSEAQRAKSAAGLAQANALLTGPPSDGNRRCQPRGSRQVRVRGFRSRMAPVIRGQRWSASTSYARRQPRFKFPRSTAFCAAMLAMAPPTQLASPLLTGRSIGNASEYRWRSGALADPALPQLRETQAVADRIAMIRRTTVTIVVQAIERVRARRATAVING
jgi:hypothetical protein